MVITGQTEVKQSFVIEPGIGSRSQDFKYIDPTILASSVDETLAN